MESRKNLFAEAEKCRLVGLENVANVLEHVAENASAELMIELGEKLGPSIEEIQLGMTSATRARVVAKVLEICSQDYSETKVRKNAAR